MIIINQNYGQLCNQLFLYAHLAAYAIEKKRTLYYPGFAKNFSYFPNLKKPGQGKILFGNRCPRWFNSFSYFFYRRFFYSNSKPTRWIESLLKIKIHFKMDPLQETFYPDIDRINLPQGICFFEGWAFRMHETFQKHSKHLRNLFELDEYYTKKASEFVRKLHGGLKIGIHIRLGDYKEEAKQWVFPMEFWKRLMQNIRQETGNIATFILVSDDPEINFNENWIIRHRGDRFEDLSLLAACDLVVGPPSTFNRWAAFSGCKPHFCTWEDKNFPHINDFKIFKLCSEKKLALNDADLNGVRWCGIA
jgi:hypothetical protein